MNKNEAIQTFLENGYLMSPDMLELENLNNNFFDVLNSKIKSKEKPIVINKDLFTAVSNNGVIEVNWLEFEKSKVLFEKKKINKIYGVFLNILNPEYKPKIEIKTELKEDIVQKNDLFNGNVTVIKQFDLPSKKISIKDFVNIFKNRFEVLKNILQTRQELKNLHSINRILNKQGGEEVSTIGLVYNKQYTKTGNIILTIEDITGFLKALITKNNLEAFKVADNTCLDEVIGLVGGLRDKTLFVSNIIFPDIINNKDKRCDDDVYVAFTSDIHVGSKMFLEDEFKRFIDWLNGVEKGKSNLGLKVKYLVLVGDLVDGIGVFPGQENYLLLKDIKDQYNKLAELLNMIRKDITIIICPGQHDSIRAAEPQPQLDKEYAGALWTLPNVVMVSNPAMINVNSKKDFEGFNILMYHGASFHYYINNINPLRMNKPRDNPSHVLKFLLQKRHLAPSHASTTYVPLGDTDSLVIDKVPDIIVSGDMHKSDVSNYNGVTIINCSCWQSKTDFQEKTGNNPDPCKVPLFSLKDKKVTMMNFSS